MPAFAQETVCANVKIQIEQQLTLERQAFNVEIKINDAIDGGAISDVSVVVKVMEENGTPVQGTEDRTPAAKFFIRVYNKQNIFDVTFARWGYELRSRSTFSMAKAQLTASL